MVCPARPANMDELADEEDGRPAGFYDVPMGAV